MLEPRALPLRTFGARKYAITRHRFRLIIVPFPGWVRHEREGRLRFVPAADPRGRSSPQVPDAGFLPTVDAIEEQGKDKGKDKQPDKDKKPPEKKTPPLPAVDVFSRLVVPPRKRRPATRRACSAIFPSCSREEPAGRRHADHDHDARRDDNRPGHAEPQPAREHADSRRLQGRREHEPRRPIACSSCTTITAACAVQTRPTVSRSSNRKRRCSPAVPRDRHAADRHPRCAARLPEPRGPRLREDVPRWPSVNRGAIPFLQQTASLDGFSAQNVGDIRIVGKYAFLLDDVTGDVLSGGLAVTAPTGPAIDTIAGTIRSRCCNPGSATSATGIASICKVSIRSWCRPMRATRRSCSTM